MHAVGDQVGRDPAGVRLLADAGVVRDHVGRGDQPGRLQGGQLGVAGSDADPVETSGVTAPPPGPARSAPRPRSPTRRGDRARSGTGRRCRGRWRRTARASFDSAAPMNPTGTPSDRSRSRCSVEQQLEQVEQRGRGVADRDHRSLEAVAPQRTRPRPTGWSRSRRQIGDPRVAQQAEHLVVPGQPCPGDARGDHVRVGQDRSARVRGRSVLRTPGRGGSPGRRRGRSDRCRAPSGLRPARRRRAGARAGPRADRRERVAVDRGPVVDVRVALGRAGGLAGHRLSSGFSPLRME